MQLLNKDRQMLDVHEYEIHKFSAEASTLGLRPYSFPEMIETDMGNKMPFIYSGNRVHNWNGSETGRTLWQLHHPVRAILVPVF